MTAATVIIDPATNNDGRLPNRPTNRPDNGENTSAPIAIGR